MKLRLFLLAAALSSALASCVTTERETNTVKDPRTVYTPPAVSDRTRMTSRTVLNTVRTAHVFSDPASPDQFVLQLRGTRVLTGRAHLIVLNKAGDTLRHEVLPARALIDEKTLDDPQAASVRDQEIAILRGMNTFFATERFNQPAVPANAEPPAELDGQTWNALRQDPQAVGFDYTGANGAERRMAYIHSLGKAVVISQ